MNDQRREWTQAPRKALRGCPRDPSLTTRIATQLNP